METHDEFNERVRRQQRLAARLRLATERLEGPRATDLGRRRGPSVGALDPADRGGHGARFVGSTNSWARKNPARSLGPETEYVAFDRPRVLRVLARVIADLDGLAGFPPIAEEEAKKGSAKLGASVTANGWRNPTRHRNG